MRDTIIAHIQSTERMVKSRGSSLVTNASVLLNLHRLLEYYPEPVKSVKPQTKKGKKNEV